MKVVAFTLSQQIAKLILLFATFLCLGAVSKARADVIIGFEGFSSTTDIAPGGSFTESGFTMTVLNSELHFTNNSSRPGFVATSNFRDSAAALRFTMPGSTFEFISYINFRGVEEEGKVPAQTVSGYLNNVLVAQDSYTPQYLDNNPRLAGNLSGVTIDRLEILAPTLSNQSPFDNVRFGNISAVPEPTSLLLFGPLGMMLCGRRNRK